MFLSNFCKDGKIYHFYSEIIFRQLLQTFSDFFLVTLIESGGILEWPGKQNFSFPTTKYICLKLFCGNPTKLPFKVNRISEQVILKFTFHVHCCSLINLKNSMDGREPWSSSYGRRLTFKRLRVRIPAPDTECTFFKVIDFEN